MVQVDVFWAYGFGASLGAACGRQLYNAAKPLESKYFVYTLLFLALIWAPTGMLLLIRHPSWETMQAAENFYSIPEWLTLAFGITNVTQGALGFWVGVKLMQARQYYYAQLNWIFGYFGMFFILLYGWDGMGYDRFLYDRDMLSGSPAWTPYAGTGDGLISAIFSFLASSVAITLAIDGVYLIPPFAVLMWLWHWDAINRDRTICKKNSPTEWSTFKAYITGVFTIGFGSAAFCAVVVGTTRKIFGDDFHVQSYFIGLPLGLLFLWLAAGRRGGLFHKMLKPLTLTKDGIAPEFRSYSTTFTPQAADSDIIDSAPSRPA